MGHLLIWNRKNKHTHRNCHHWTEFFYFSSHFNYFHKKKKSKIIIFFLTNKNWTVSIQESYLTKR